MRFRCIALLLRGRLRRRRAKVYRTAAAQPDLPYLKHAENLVPTEMLEAKEEKGKKDDDHLCHRRSGLERQNPLASPIFLLQDR